MTNYEFIKEMSINELAEYLHDIYWDGWYDHRNGESQEGDYMYSTDYYEEMLSERIS